MVPDCLLSCLVLSVGIARGSEESKTGPQLTLEVDQVQLGLGSGASTSTSGIKGGTKGMSWPVVLCHYTNFALFVGGLVVVSPSPEPLGSVSHRSTSPPKEIIHPSVQLKHQLPLFRDSEDEGSEDQRTPKRVKFPEAAVDQISLPKPVTGMTPSANSHKKGRPSTIVSERDKAPQLVVRQGYDCLAYLLQGLIYINVSVPSLPLLHIILKGVWK